MSNWKLTPRENYMELYNHSKPERFVNCYEPFDVFFSDAISARLHTRERGKDVKDAWGTLIRWKADDIAGIPYITDETKVLPDVTEWQKYVKAPYFALTDKDEDWELALQTEKNVNRKEKLLTGFLATGFFEQLHYLMGFEDTLMNLLVEPEAIGELLDYILEWRMHYVKILIDRIHPDIILSHDDWGAKDRLFMSGDTWRELFKPRYAKLYGYIKSRGVQIMHHSDSYCVPIIHDMVDVGIDIWQGVLPSNDIPKLQKELGGKLNLMGGLDCGKIDVPGWTDDLVRTEVDRAVKEYAPGGSFIPCYTYGDPGTIYGIHDTISDEIEKQSVKLYK
jgi:hypothetical protein